MRRVKIFSGSSHPVLVEAICERLGTQPAKCDLKKFSNGETSVSIDTSIRDQDVFIVQSGSSKTNDSVMELLIMISACKGGSAKSITAVMPYFPYSRQSKKKSHRGAITARMVANLLGVAGINHVITVDLHAPPTQGFFGKPVDNLHAEPLIARWIRNNVKGWKEAVVVSKNPGGSKRVTSLADALKLNFGIITTDRRRTTMGGSSMLDMSGYLDRMGEPAIDARRIQRSEAVVESQIDSTIDIVQAQSSPRQSPRLQDQNVGRTNGQANGQVNGHINGASPSMAVPQRHHVGASPLFQARGIDSESPPSARPLVPRSTPADELESGGASVEEYTDERAREVLTGRLIQGHLVDDDHPSPVLSTMSGSVATLPAELMGTSQFDDQDPMTSSFISTLSAFPSNHALGGTIDAVDDDEDDFQNPEFEHTITLVGNVKDRTVIIMDDLIDQCGSWIAAAETVVKRGGAKRVYCVATHGLFGYDSLEQMEACECIDYIVVTNTYPIASDRARASKKLIMLDISHLLSEAIRRNHYGESISQLFAHYTD